MKRVFSIILFVFLLIPSICTCAEKEWTWLVFLNADNNLDQFGVDDQGEMAQVGSNEWLNIVSLIDREKGPATINYIEKGKIVPIENLGEVDMGDYKFLVAWTKNMMAKFPAKHYTLIIWNHGSGWKQNPDNGLSAKGLSYDDSSGNHMTTEQIGLAMASIKKDLGRNIDILGMDACLMQMAEVAYAAYPYCDFIVASEETEPGEGYPYQDILRTLTADAKPEAFVKSWVKAYSASYDNGSQGSSASTQSALKCSEIPALRDAIDGFAKAAVSGAYATQFKDALLKVQKFYYRTNIDLLHLNTLLKASIQDEGFKTAADKMGAAIKAAVVANGTTGSPMANAQGLAIYFPSAAYNFDKTYLNLAFAKETLWDEMIQDFYKKSTVSTIQESLTSGDISALRDFATKAAIYDTEIVKYVIHQVNYMLYVEKEFSNLQTEIQQYLQILQK